MNVTFFSDFSKRRNSTKRPSGGVTYDVVFKAGTSVESPAFLIHADPGTIRSFTYAKMGGHYYFIDDIILMRENSAEIRCSQDVLATYKTDIGAYEGFVARSSHTYDRYIDDGAISRKYTASHRSRTVGQLSGWSSTGTYLIRVVGGNANSSSALGISTYAVPADKIRTLLNFMFNEANEGWGDMLSDVVVKAFFNPFQYIVSLVWMPFDISKFDRGQGSEVVWFGWWSSGVSCMKVTGHTLYTSTSVSLPTGSYSDFRDYSANWTTYDMYLPGLGTVPCSRSIAGDALDITYDVDIATGNAQIRVFDQSDPAALVATYSAALGVNVQIGQSATNLEAVAASALDVAEVAANPANAINLQNDVSIIKGLSAVAQPMNSILGSHGNMSALLNNPSVVISMIQSDSCEIPLEYAGRPLYQKKTLSSIPGYIQCVGASVPLNALESDRAEVNSYLNGGFYYE